MTGIVDLDFCLFKSCDSVGSFRKLPCSITRDKVNICLIYKAKIYQKLLKFKMGRFALVEYSLIRQLCQDLKREKNTFSGRLKDFENDRKTSQSDKIQEARRLLLSTETGDKAQCTKRKREKGKKRKAKRARRSPEPDDQEGEGETQGITDDSESSSASESTSGDSESGGGATTSDSDEDL